jgi:hypothetical protein
MCTAGNSVIVHEIIIGGTLNVLNHIVVSHLKNLTTPDLVHFGYQCSFGQIAISVDMLNKVTLCEISSSHGGEYDVQSCLLGCTAV